MMIQRLIAAAVLLVSAWVSVTMLAASLIQRSVEQEVAGNPDAVGLTDRLQLALRIDADNPETLSALARLQPREDAVTTFRRVTEIAPNNARAWADLFAVKMALAEIDDESFLALRQAVQLGPYEPEVIEIVLRAGSRKWLSLGREGRQIVSEMAIRGIEGRSPHRKIEILGVLDEAGLLRLACSSERVSQSPYCPTSDT